MERTLTYVLGYLLEAGGAGTSGGETGDSLMDYFAYAAEGGRVLAIKLRADNDFYSQTSQASLDQKHVQADGNVTAVEPLGAIALLLDLALFW